MVFINLTGDGKKTPVQVHRVLYGTLEYNKLPRFQRLLGYVSDLVDVYVEQKTEASEQLAEIQTYTMLETEIEELWFEYVNEAVDTDTLLFWEDISTGTRHFRDAFTALVVAYFSAARILLGITMTQLTNVSPILSDHYTSILLASQYLQTHSIGCAYMRMATPLLLVSLHSPDSSQRKQAVAYFEVWTQRSMSGISALALDAIHRHCRWNRTI
jgi:hypothetical protein